MNTDLNITGAACTPTVHPAPMAAKPVAQHTAQGQKPAAIPAAPKVDPVQMMQELQEAVHKLNEEMKKNGRELDFSMDKVLDYPVVTVKNSVTGEVIRQIPNETTIRIAHNLAELKGLFHNKSA